jgi:hypothetical protein
MVVSVNTEEQFGIRVLQGNQTHQKPVQGEPFVIGTQIGVQTGHHSFQLDLMEGSGDFHLGFFVGFKDGDAFLAGVIHETG